MIIAAILAALTQYVNPFIGTQGTGHTYPGATVPCGMVQAGPDTGVGDWAHCAGYQYNDKKIIGFSQTHLSGTGCPDLGDVSLNFWTGDPGDYTSEFRKETEKAKPGWYEVHLDRYGITVRVTATAHVACYTVTPDNPATRVQFRVNPGFAIANKEPLDYNLLETLDSGEGWYTRKVWCKRTVDYTVQSQAGEKGALLVKVAISRNKGKSAENMQLEVPGWDFDAVEKEADKAWEWTLNTMHFEGDSDQLVAAYTALYHLFFQPNIISDAKELTPRYSTFSLWDTYRAAHPMYAILNRALSRSFANSLILQGEEQRFLPVWSLWGEDTDCMIGSHAVPVIVDDILRESRLKGKFNPKDLPPYIKRTYKIMRDTLRHHYAKRSKDNWDILDRHGYFPYDIIKGESVSRTLECAYDDHCAAMFAEAIGNKKDAEFFNKRAENWKNVFDSSIGFVRGKDSEGNWREPFDPLKIGGGANWMPYDCTEGNAWQYLWSVQHDPKGLIEKLGGKSAALKKLETFFTLKSESHEGDPADVSGMIGQYAHGNEPSHHVIYLFNYLGRSDLAAKYIREVFDTQYGITPDGLCGNDDCGQMSAWYLFSAAGFYPFDPCGGKYVLGAPQFRKVEIRPIRGNRPFVVKAPDLSKENKYVKSVKLNGKPLEGFTIDYSDIVNGGELFFEMVSEL